MARVSRTVVVAALALALPATAAAQVPPPLVLTSGHADWGVKASFRSYVTGPIAHGTITASDGATTNADGTFRFTLTGGSYDVATHAVTADFDGTVRFTGHEGTLDLTISDPRVETAGRAGTLYADTRSRNASTGQFEERPDVAVATLDLSGSAVTPGAGEVAIGPIAATLTEAGAPAFGGFYPAGAALDPVSLLVSYTAPPTPMPTPTPTPTPTPSPTPTPQAPPPPQQSPGAGRAPLARIGALGRERAVRGARVSLARIESDTGAWTVGTPKRVSFKLAGRRHSAAVIAPRRVAAGQRATVRLRLRKATVEALAGRKARVQVKVTLRSGATVVSETIRATLVRGR